MKIVFGLGNPGKQYEITRHNAGFMFVERLAEKLKAEPWKYVDKFKSDVAACMYGKEKVILVKPQTFMNLSALCVEKVHSYYKPEEEDMIVVYDDIDVKLSSFKLRRGGGAGTHNGARAIKEYFKQKGIDFPRLRIGIDTESLSDYEGDISNFVLGKMTKDELTIISSVIEKAIEALLFTWDEGFEAAMQAYNS